MRIKCYAWTCNDCGLRVLPGEFHSCYCLLEDTSVALTCTHCGQPWSNSHICFDAGATVAYDSPWCCICGFFHGGACVTSAEQFTAAPGEWSCLLSQHGRTGRG